MAPTLQEVFKRYFPAYRKKHKLPVHLLKAAQAFMLCRTAKLGGHQQVCPDGHFQRNWYNSCKHRSCPQCRGLELGRWLQEQQARLLRCQHFHVIFTIPDRLRLLWWHNQTEMTMLLFDAVRKTLFSVLENPKFMGARPGVIASLHTWGRTLIQHPHVHCLVSGIGLSCDGRFLHAQKEFLMPYQLARQRFRERLMKAIRRSYDKGKLKLPSTWTRSQFSSILTACERIKWNVKFKEQYRHGKGVLLYLARYVRGGPIGNNRILSCDDGKVTFNYQPNDSPRTETMTLDANEFIRRVLDHVPMPRARVVRYWGLYAKQKVGDLAKAREFLGQAPMKEVELLTAEEFLEENDLGKKLCCPVCGKPLVVGEEIPKGGARAKMGKTAEEA